MKNLKSTKQLVLGTVVAVGALVLILMIATFSVIYLSVRRNCNYARGKFGKDCADSLVMQLTWDKSTFREKNQAIWTLGQLADRRALPVLQRLYTGNIPTRESYDLSVSQYELKKAITWCQYGNLTSWMYGFFPGGI